MFCFNLQNYIFNYFLNKNCFIIHFREWGDLIAQLIHEKLYVNRESEIADVLKEIKRICQKTEDDLTNILRGLEDFLLKVQPEDQSKRKNIYLFFNKM